MEFSIETASYEHITDVRALELAGAAMFSFDDLPQSLRYRVTGSKTLVSAIQESRLWVAKNDAHKTIGFALAEIVDEEAHLAELDVSPEHSRCGIGTKLVQQVCAWADLRGSGLVTLITFRHVPWNAPFYAKLGFVAIPESELGPGLRSLIQEEATAGLNIENRVCMRFLPGAGGG